MPRTCILTVGSTRFDPLVAAFLRPTVLSSLASLGVERVFAQVGNSVVPLGWTEGRNQREGLAVEVVKFAPDVEREVAGAELVVSHAGAGSILSFLRPLPGSLSSASSSTTTPPPRRRRLILVPNSTLMDSHQSDLADEMQKKGWAVVVERADDLSEALKKLARDASRPAEVEEPSYPSLDEVKVQRILDETLGYV
ncbi:hypothetical protein JCM10213_007327 [Rhodosporidiobolus nylandii]